MMNESGFIQFMRREKKTPSTVKRYVDGVKTFEAFLAAKNNGKQIEDALKKDILDFVREKRGEIRDPVLNACVYGLMNYFKYVSKVELYNASREISDILSVENYRLRDFMGVDKEQIRKLESMGIKTARQMLDHGKTEIQRKDLSLETGIPQEKILELVKLADLARIGGLKKKRARLFYNAGFDTIEKIAKQDSEELRRKLIEYVEETGFDGVASSPGEAVYTVSLARYLHEMVDY
jgi:hypothetical protein